MSPTHRGGNSVQHPPHYNHHPSGVECIELVELLSFNLGNAVKYLWRAGEKLDEVEDLKKALWYCEREADLLNRTPAYDWIRINQEAFRLLNVWATAEENQNIICAVARLVQSHNHGAKYLTEAADCIKKLIKEHQEKAAL